MGRVAGGELTSTYGTVVWDGIGTLRIRYGGTLVRTRLGERIVPVEALRAVELTDTGLRLVLRDGADPLQSVTQPIELYDFPGVDHEAAEEIARDVGQALVRRDVPETAAAAWMVAPPPAPDRIEGRDATLAMANGQLTFKYHRSAGRKKKALGDPWSVPLGDIVDVEWAPHGRTRRAWIPPDRHGRDPRRTPEAEARSGRDAHPAYGGSRRPVLRRPPTDPNPPLSEPLCRQNPRHHDVSGPQPGLCLLAGPLLRNLRADVLLREVGGGVDDCLLAE